MAIRQTKTLIGYVLQSVADTDKTLVVQSTVPLSENAVLKILRVEAEVPTSFLLSAANSVDWYIRMQFHRLDIDPGAGLSDSNVITWIDWTMRGTAASATDNQVSPATRIWEPPAGADVYISRDAFSVTLASVGTGQQNICRYRIWVEKISCPALDKVALNA